MKAKIESVKKTRTFGEPPRQVYEVVTKEADGKTGIYDCFNEKCESMIGQEVEFEVKKASDSKYHDTMKLGGGGQQTGGKFQGRTFQISFAQTAEGEKLKSKTMVLSYAKDMVTQFMVHKTDASFADCLTNVKLAYETMVPLLHLDQVRDAREEQKQQSGNGHKNLATLLAEMKSIASLNAFSNWWKAIMPAYNALSTEDQQKLIVEKDKKKSELTGAPTTQQISF